MKKLLISAELGTLADTLRLAGQYDVSVELTDFSIPSLLRDGEATAGRAACLNAAGLPAGHTLHGAFYDVNVASIDADIAAISGERMRASMNAARLCAARAVVFHTGINTMLTQESYRHGWLESNLRFFDGLLREYRETDIYIENMFDDSPEPLADLSERLCSHPNYGVCLDYAHANVYSGDPVKWFDALSSYVRHIHINDNNLREDEHLPVGDGAIDWARFFSLYAERTPRASVLLENPDAASRRRSLEYLERHGYIDVIKNGE